MIFAIECVAVCLLFTLLVKVATAKKSEALVNDYPPIVTDKLRKARLIAEKPPAKKTDIIRMAICTRALYGAEPRHSVRAAIAAISS